MSLSHANKKFLETPIPARMQHLPKDPRGYPIPSVVYRDAEGKPHFTINDEAVRQEHIVNDVCAISGKKLFKGRWFVGGPRSAFDPAGVYIDTPMHYECVEYALKVCPYLAMPSYKKRIGSGTVKDDSMIFEDPSLEHGKPQLFVAVMCVGVDYFRDRITNRVQYLKPKRPYRMIEFWQAGRKLSRDEAFELLKGVVPYEHLMSAVDKSTLFRWGEKE